MPEIGKAYVQIVPTAQGISGAIENLIGGEAEKAGKSAGAKIASGIGGALAAGTGAAAAFAAEAVKVGAGFDSAMSQVAATMGKTMEEMKDEVGSVDLAWGSFEGNLREYALEMGQNTAFSATQAAEALNYMALAGYKTQTSMEMLPNVLNLAAAGSMDLARASDMITDTQTAFGISLERTTQLVDEMAKAASTGNTSVEQLGDAFLVVGGLAAELNGGFVTLSDGTRAEVDGVQELEIALTAMANAGVKGSEAGTHMRNMLLKLADPTKDGREAMKALRLSVFDTEGDMRSLQDIMGDLAGAFEDLSQEEKLSYISDLFNTRDIAAAEALLNAVEQDWNAIGAAILEADSAAQQMADTQLDNLRGDVTLLKSAFESVQISVSDALTPSLREFAQFGTDALTSIGNAVKEGGLEAGIEELGRQLSDGITMIVEKIPEMASAGGKLIGALLDGLLSNAGGITQAAVDIVVNLATEFGNNLDELIPAATDAIMTIAETLLSVENLDRMLDAALDIVKNLAKGIVDAIPEITKRLPELIDGIVNWLTDDAVPDILDAGTELLSQLADDIDGIVDGLVESVLKIVDGLVELLTNPEKTRKIMDAGIKLMGTLLTKTPEILDALGQGLLDLVTGLVDRLLGKEKTDKVELAGYDMMRHLSKEWADLDFEIDVEKLVVDIVEWLTGIKTLRALWNAGKKLAVNFWEGLKSGFSGSEYDGTVSYLEGKIENLSGSLTDNEKRIQIPEGDKSPVVVERNITRSLTASDERMYSGLSYDEDAETNELHALREDLGDMLQTLNGTLQSMDGMRVVLDSGEVVGALSGPLNSSLGRQYVYDGRGI